MMAGTIESGRVCHSCGSTNQEDAQRCGTCGAELDSSPDPGEHFVDDEPALRYVDLSNRHELERFERLG